MNQSTNMYVKFDPNTGKILSCGSTKNDSCLQIDTALGEKFIMGLESFHKYKVIYHNGEYRIQKEGVLNTVNNVTKKEKTKIINSNVYKIPKKTNNHNGIQIKLYQNQGMIEFIADNVFKKTLETIVSKENNRTHKFYCCKSNDATQLIQTLDLNLYELFTQDNVKINIDLKNNMDIYCRKIFDYSIERIYE